MNNLIKFYFPKWIFLNNLGDSINATFIPRILKKINKNCKIEIITDGFLIDIFKLDPNVDLVRKPTFEELHLNYPKYAFSDKQFENIKVVYPDWHPNVFNFWKNNFDFLCNHPTANLITVNFLLQLKLENLLFDKSFDFREFINIENEINTSEFINIAIVPATKLSGKTEPHPGCNGKGLRFNGNKGIESWKQLTTQLKEKNSKIKIFEFSKENFGLGDYHFPEDKNIFNVIKNIDLMDFGIMSDGGLHHIFNARNKKVFLFQATKINKVEFFKLSNTIFPEELHLECRKQCPSYFLEMFEGENKSLKCNLECEDMNPLKLANFILQNISK